MALTDLASKQGRALSPFRRQTFRGYLPVGTQLSPALVCQQLRQVGPLQPIALCLFGITGRCWMQLVCSPVLRDWLTHQRCLFGITKKMLDAAGV